MKITSLRGFPKTLILMALLGESWWFISAKDTVKQEEYIKNNSQNGQVEQVVDLSKFLNKRQDLRAAGSECLNNDHKCSVASPTQYLQCYRNVFIDRSCGKGTKCIDTGSGRLYCAYI
ncbi:hypothetical protein BB561_002860 [Smittium simulii]|uniref:Carbohydrate-binding module family 19 domain-containing protein n=1 Tax=Smittium simulii TaxID=133385 RepID=A0A2T9YNW1_9FUNG|nr:hypothetical protein BB561_002860 [Smittium simulii]